VQGTPEKGFGSDARLSYGSYLKVPELLRLQELKSSPVHPDELLFIVVHQTYELWFRLTLHELERARAAALAGRLDDALEPLWRVHAIEGLLIDSLGVMETLAPSAFLGFRDHLRPASGFQSVQFREIELVSGLREAPFLEFMRAENVPEVHAAMDLRLAEPSLRDALHFALRSKGFDLGPEGAVEEAKLDAALLRVYSTHDPRDLYRFCEALTEHDERIRTWRQRHVLMVERIIGMKTGTGGSTGAPYLRSTTQRQFYPELWRVRGALDPSTY
jgi:tryptophan 2,3-dioxygenase